MKQRVTILFMVLFLLVTTFTGALTEVLAAPGALKWKYPISSDFGGSRPAVGLNGIVYLPTNDRLVALTTSSDGTPTPVWEFLREGYGVGTPSVDTNGNIYFQSGAVYALDANKNVLWTYGDGMFGNNWNLPTDVAIGPDHTIYTDRGGAWLYAIDSSNQNPKTEKWIAYQGSQPPALSPNGDIYTIGAQYWPWYLYKLNPTDGSVLTHSPDPPWINSHLPVIGKDYIYMTNSTGPNIWTYHFDTTPANNYDDPIYGRYGSPVIGSDGTVYLVSTDERYYPDYHYYLKVFNPDLTENWTLDLTEYAVGGIPAVGNDGNVFLASGKYGLIVVNPSTKQVIWDAREIFVAGFLPVMGPDGTIYIQGYDTQAWYLFAISYLGCTGPANSPWHQMGANAQHTHVANNPAPPPPPAWKRISGPWSQACDGFFTSIAVDPSNPQTVYIGNSHSTKGCGIYKSIDGGKTWLPKNQGIRQIGLFRWKHYPAVSKIVVSSDSRILYFGSQDGYLYRTTDGGDNWVDARGRNGRGYTRIHDEVLTLAADQADPNTVIAGVAFQGVFKTTDMGGSWKLIRKGRFAIGATDYYSVVDIDPSNPQNIFVAGYTAYDTSILPCGLEGQCVSLNGVLPLGPFKSVDGGSTWRAAVYAPDLFALLTDLKVSNDQSDILYASTMAYLNPYGGAFDNLGVFKSLDGGRTWTGINNAGETDLSQLPVYQLGKDLNSSNTIYAVAGFSGIFETTDGGATWTRTTTQGLPSNTFVRAIAVSGQTLFALTTDGIYQLS